MHVAVQMCRENAVEMESVGTAAEYYPPLEGRPHVTFPVTSFRSECNTAVWEPIMHRIKNGVFGMLRREALVRTDVFGELSNSIIRVTIGELRSLAVTLSP
jgi:hypothetical protein